MSGSGDVEDLVAALEVLEVLERRILRLQHGAHRTAGHHHTGGERVSRSDSRPRKPAKGTVGDEA